MIRLLSLRNFTVFTEADFEFGALNVIHGVNGTGKTHVLKLGYALAHALANPPVTVKPGSRTSPTKAALSTILADELVSVFRPDKLGRLTRRAHGQSRPEVAVLWEQGSTLSFEFAATSTTFVTVGRTPTEWHFGSRPVFLPPREMLSIYPRFVSAYESKMLEFDSTWRDLCLLLGRRSGSPPPNPRSAVHSISVDNVINMHKSGLPASVISQTLKSTAAVFDLGNKELAKLRHMGVPDSVIFVMMSSGLDSASGWKEQVLAPIERAIGATVVLDSTGRFYLEPMRDTGDREEMHLVAEGYRKLATLAQLVANRSISKGSIVFWDEPEANLNPMLIRVIARTLVQMAAMGVQVFVATHSLYLMRELHILQKSGAAQPVPTRYFGLHREDGAVTVQQGDTIEASGDIVALNLDLEQAERYIDLEMGVPGGEQ